MDQIPDGNLFYHYLYLDGGTEGPELHAKRAHPNANPEARDLRVDPVRPRGAEPPRRDLIIHPADLQCQEDPADCYQGKARQI